MTENILEAKASGGGEDLTFPYLNAQLLGKPWDGNMNKLIALLESGAHSVPQGPKELAASQNLFWLKAGAEREMWPNRSNRSNTDDQLIARLKRERDEIGLWGSEQTSPIYHHYTITGMAATWLHSNGELKNLIEQNLASFFWLAEKMGLYNQPHGLIGQRGTGHNFTEHGFPDLHFVMRYYLGGRPQNYKQAGGWKNFLKNSGWVFAGVRGGRLYDLYKRVFEIVVDNAFKPWGVMIPIHFTDFGIHFIERGTNGNTPELGGYKRGIYPKYLPDNERVRVRQRASRGVYTPSIIGETYLVKYNGIYTELQGSGSQTLSSKVYSRFNREMVYDMNGPGEWRTMDQIYGNGASTSAPASPSAPTAPPVTTKPTKRNWKDRFMDWLGL